MVEDRVNGGMPEGRYSVARAEETFETEALDAGCFNEGAPLMGRWDGSIL